MRRLLIVVAIGGLLLAACGSDGNSLSSYQKSLVPGFKTSLVNKNKSGVVFTDAQQTCLANGVIGAVSDAHLKALGLTAKNAAAKFATDPKLDKADATKAAAAYQKCVDFKAVLEKAFTLQKEKFTAKEAACIFKPVTDAELHDYIVASLQGGSIATAASNTFEKSIAASVTKCISAKRLAEIGAQ
jgi:hypothetical protein